MPSPTVYTVSGVRLATAISLPPRPHHSYLAQTLVLTEILLLTSRPPWSPAPTAELDGSELRVPVTPLLESRPWSTYTSPHTKQYSSCTGDTTRFQFT